MITKEDVLEYFSQLEEKVIKLDHFYGELYSKVHDLDLKELLIQLKCEEKVHLELVHRLKEIFEEKWKE